MLFIALGILLLGGLIYRPNLGGNLSSHPVERIPWCSDHLSSQPNTGDGCWVNLVPCRCVNSEKIPFHHNDTV
jgi:hypothetical protein